MKMLGAGKKSVVDVSGEALVADFHSALLNLVTMDVAKAQANQSEADITAALQYSAPGNGVYITPGDLTPDTQETLLKRSVDAHLKKVQAAQIGSHATAQVSQLEAEDLRKYKGRKVRVTNLGDAKDVFVPLWAHNQTGELRESTFTGKSITGIIDDLSFEKDVLVLKPTFLSRTFSPGRKYFLVYVINMQTVMPDVAIQLV